MKTYKLLPLLTALALAASGGALAAEEDTVQPAPPSEGSGDTGDAAPAPERGRPDEVPPVTPPVGPPDETPQGSDKRPEVVPQDLGRLLHQENQPDKLKRPAMPDEVKGLVEQFQTEREAYIEAQAQLRLSLKTAQGDDRAAVREQLRDLRERWLENQRQLRDQLRDQLRELREKLRDARDEQLNDARELRNRRGAKPGE